MFMETTICLMLPAMDILLPCVGCKFRKGCWCMPVSLTTAKYKKGVLCS